MIQFRLIVFTGLLMLLYATGLENGYAMDESGCLTCHQYPGLVRPEEPEGFKVFHIDENRYLRSPHGETECRQCHINVTRVPHVGATEVNCTNSCHLSEKDKKMLADYDLDELHEDEKFYITRLADGSSCRACHRLYPHRSNKLARAFINMHIGFMTCETCHINREQFEPLQYEWMDSEAADFAGEPFGARFNPNMTEAPESSHFISRISVFTRQNGEQRSLFNTWDTEEARAYLEREEDMTEDEKKERLDYFHRDIHKLEASVTCKQCHSEDGILDFEQLGFSEKNARKLMYLNIKGLVTKYKVFYFPDLLHPE